MASHLFKILVALYRAGGEMVWLVAKPYGTGPAASVNGYGRAGGVHAKMIPIEVIHEGILSRVARREAPIEFLTFSLVGSPLEFFASPALARHLAPGRRVYAVCVPTPRGGRAVIELLHCDADEAIPEADKAALIRRREHAGPSRAWQDPRRN